ncbi:PREDICTED: B- and T-lymphocyte attenuator [Miniopterus natalensis]|uniref:B- and T-lymphocyte attenuator n=1 Tax=Miniopterus natalensis TaxID=291302 RepID=UPI0007A6DD66|nr:PREDICTED: B- and T-lymphocyte attenuator [Miniopterus natalensis]
MTKPITLAKMLGNTDSISACVLILTAFSEVLQEIDQLKLAVEELTQNNSEPPLKNTTSTSGPPSRNEVEDRHLILYSLLPLGALPLLMTCFYLFFCLRRHQGGGKKPSISPVRGVDDVPQPFRREQIEVDARQNSQTLTSETSVYDNDPWCRLQEEPVVYSHPRPEENKQGIVYASLNHSIIEMNLRQARNVKEAPTEYAAICVRS